MELLEIMQRRRSVRKYSGEPVPEEALTKILQAGLLTPSGHALYPCELIVVRDRAMLERLAECRVRSAGMLRGAEAAIVVVANENLSDVWTEDSAVMMENMHLMAASLGVGSCWIQGRLRLTPEDRPTEDFVRECLGFPANMRLEAILSLGMPEKEAKKRLLAELKTDKIHYEKF